MKRMLFDNKKHISKMYFSPCNRTSALPYASVAIVTFLMVSFIFLMNGLYERSVEINHTATDLNLLIEQRNNLSRELNLKQKKIGQMECERLRNKKVATSGSGGWCRLSSTEDGGAHMTDENLVEALRDFFLGKYVGSFGDGPGRYKQMLDDSGLLIGYDAYDGAPFCEDTSHGRVKFLDLTLTQYGLPIYDWVMSLEVAEHIPRQFESVYIDNVVRHARRGVVLSWAHPGQDGYSHVNNRPFDYVKSLMDSSGFYHDEKESKHLKDASSFHWFRNNTNVFRRKIRITRETLQINA